MYSVAKVFSYINAFGTFILGSLIDLLILALFNFYTPAFGVVVMVYNLYRVFKNRFTTYTPPKQSIHRLVGQDEVKNLYEMFAEAAPKGARLRIFRSIGLDDEYVASVDKKNADLYIEEDFFLRLNKNNRTRAVGFSLVIFDSVTAALYKRPTTDVGWMDKIGDFADTTSAKYKNENAAVKNSMAKAAILGGIVGGGAGAVVAGSSVGVAKAGERGPAMLLLLPMLGYLLFLLAIMLVMLPVYLMTALPIKKRVEAVAKSNLGRDQAEVKMSWRGGKEQLLNEEFVEIDPHHKSYQPDSGWKPAYEFDLASEPEPSVAP